jgi:type II secretory pathway component PulJ
MRQAGLRWLALKTGSFQLIPARIPKPVRAVKQVDRHRSGLSLIEIMIALTMTLIILGAMMTAFQSISREMQRGRAMIELASRVRNIETTLRSDLANLTVEPRPYTTTLPTGYFQIVEGPRTDKAQALTVNSAVGDIDDTLSMTVQTKGRLFRGRLADISGTTQMIESPIAEIVWFPVWNEQANFGTPDYEERFEIRRRILLVRPELSLPNSTDLTWDQVVAFFLNNDISARIEPSLTTANRFNLIPNQLADLSIRDNRFGHLPVGSAGTNGAFLTWPVLASQPTFNTANPSTNELGFPNQQHYKMLLALSSTADVVLTDIVAFDVRVHSPNANVAFDQAAPNASMVLEPGDFVSVPAPNPYGDFGAFVDLGFTDLRRNPPVAAPDVPAWFSGLPTSVLGNWPFSTYPPDAAHTLREAVFDTWTPAYESDGLDQDRSGLADQGTDGLDNDNQNGVDDIGERETRPPYNHPIRGIEIRIRTVEKVTKQVHQTTVKQSFVPE